MKHRPLGQTGFAVSEVGFGAWGISGAQWIGATEDQSLAALRAAAEKGVDFIDTARAYGDGRSEQLCGQIIREFGSRSGGGLLRVATKLRPKNQIWPVPPDANIGDVYPYEYILESTEESLRNLRVEAIDLLQLHVWNPEWVQQDDWHRAFETLKKSGKIRAAGVSLRSHLPDTGVTLVESGLIDAVQVVYNIFDQTAEQKLFPACRKHHVGVIARVPFDEGSLTGRINENTEFPEGDFRNSYFRGDRKQQVSERINAIARDLNLQDLRELPAIALRFCLSAPEVTSVIPGMRSISSVNGNVMAAGQGPLPAEIVDILRRHTWNRNFYTA